MKKLFALFMALIMALSMVACSGQDSASSVETSNPVPVTEERKEPVKEEPKSAEVKKTAAEIEFDEVTVVDNDKCTIKITKIDPDNTWGFTLKAFFENKTPDKTYMFSVSDASVNGIKSDPFFATDVAAGKKSNSEISFSDKTIEELNIDFTDIRMSFKVSDYNDWLADPIAEETVHIYPYGEDEAVQYVRESQPTDTVIVDDDNVTAIITGYENDDVWGYTANIFLINKTDAEVMFSVNEASVNGFMVDPFWGATVSPKECAFSSMSWSNDEFAKNDITEVEEIEFTFKATNYNDFTDNMTEEHVVLKP